MKIPRMWLKCLVMAITLSLTAGYSYTGERSIRSSVLSSFAYDRMARPAASTTAYVGFNLLAINDVNIESHEFVCTGWFTVLWNDNRLQWLPVIYDDTEYIHALESEIWKPEVLVDNALEAIELISDDHLIYRIKYNGDVEWEPPVSEKVYCGIDVTYFPFDVQTCTIELLSWGLPKPELVLYKLWDHINFNEYRESGSWEILSSSINESDVNVFRRNNTKETYSQIDITFTVQRKPGLFILNTIIPIVVTSYLILVAFLIPAGSGEKMTFAILTLLIEAVLMILFLEQVPGVSTSTSVFSFYSASNLCMGAAVCVICAIISQVHHHPAESKISLIHKIIIIFLKKVTCWCDPDPPVDEEPVVVHMTTMATDDLKKIERSTFFAKRNVIKPELADGFTEKVHVRDEALLPALDDLKHKTRTSSINPKKPKELKKMKRGSTYNKFNWTTVAKVWDRFFFIAGCVAVTLFHLTFLNILRAN